MQTGRNPKDLEMTVKPLFNGRDFKVAQNMCFVLMPLKENFLRLYDEHVRPTIELQGFKVKKADDIFLPSVIIDDIWALINQARLIVADVTGKNANVFYELGMAHTVGKDTIIMTQSPDDIPFDIKNRRYLKYTDNGEGWTKLRNNLGNYVRSVIFGPAQRKLVADISKLLRRRKYRVQTDYQTEGVFFDLKVSNDEMSYLMDVITPDRVTIEHVKAFFAKLHVSEAEQAVPTLISTAPVSAEAEKLCDRLKIDWLSSDGGGASDIVKLFVEES
jgi:hypothetical protein